MEVKQFNREGLSCMKELKKEMKKNTSDAITRIISTARTELR